MKRLLLIPIVVYSLMSCSDKPQKPIGVFEISDTVKNVRAVTFDWAWSSHGVRKDTAYFEIDGVDLGGNANVYSLMNTGIVSDVYTYKDGKPDFDRTRRAWIIEYSGNSPRVDIEWSGIVEQISGKGTSAIEVLFQVYSDLPFRDRHDIGYGMWPVYSNNMRPQIEIDTLFLGMGFSEEELDLQREQARNRMLARYYNAKVDISPIPPIPQTGSDNEDNGEEEEEEEEEELEEEKILLPISGNATYYFPLPPTDATPETVDMYHRAKYRMQLFIRITSNDGNSNAQYKISDGRLSVVFQ